MGDFKEEIEKLTKEYKAKYKSEIKMRDGSIYIG